MHRPLAALALLLSPTASAQFGSFVSSPAPADIADRALGDIDGDGRVDMVYRASAGTARSLGWSKGNGDGTFAANQLIFQTPTDRFSSLALGDLDGDGDGDLLIGPSSSSSTMVWHENLGGSGPLGPPQTFPGSFRPGTPVISDFNGDGHEDVLFRQGLFNASFGICDGLGGGAFAQVRIVGLVADVTPGVNPSGLAAADLDLDGHVDIVGLSGGAFFWLLNSGGGQFATAELITPLSSTMYSDLQLGDVDGDGDTDLFSRGSELGFVENLARTPIGTAYCSPAVNNSTGVPGVMAAIGSTSLARNDVLLVARQLPPATFGLFAASSSQGLTVGVGGGAGTLCLGSPLVRVRGIPVLTDQAGQLRLRLDLPTDLQQTITAGETWHFQAWHRDAGLLSNLTDALSIAFTP